MASAALEKLRAFWDSQVKDEEKWAFNYVSAPLISQLTFVVLLRCSCRVTAVGPGSVVFVGAR